MRQSVKARAVQAAVPELGDPAMVSKGGRHYRENCQTCHAGPGAERSEMARGLRPAPPELTREATHWSSAELFWIVKHGIKMTGMPAWGESHDDKELWAIVAFLERLPNLSPQEYRELTSGSGAPEGGH
jgi:mono/diheme cytochrome c family protein